MRLSCFLGGALLATGMTIASVAHAVNADPSSFAETAWQQSASLTQAGAIVDAPAGTGLFRWTPLAADLGVHEVTVYALSLIHI